MLSIKDSLTWHLRLFTLFAKSRNLATLFVTAVLSSGASALMPQVLSEVPIITTTNTVVPLLVAPAIAICFWTFCVPSASSELEKFIPRRRIGALHAAWYLGSTTVILLFLLAPIWLLRPIAGAELVLIRNALLAIAIACVCGQLLSQRVSWLPLFIYTLASWVFGTRDESASPAIWAFFNYPVTSLTVGLIAVLTWLVVGIWYCLHPLPQRETAITQ